MDDAGARGTGTGERKRLSRRLDEIGWALLFLMSGAILAVPGIPHPWAAWFIGVGAILLGLNLVRYITVMRVELLTTGCGVIAAAAGIGAYLGVEVPILALVLLLIGVLILVEPVFKRSAHRA
jgi:hypothetical protein